MSMFGNLKGGGLNIAIAIIMLSVAMQIVFAALPTLLTAFINISQIANLSFASFFAAGGVVLLIVSVALLIGVFKALGVGKGR